MNWRYTLTAVTCFVAAFGAGFLAMGSVANSPERIERAARGHAVGSMEYGYACAERGITLERCRANMHQAMTPK